MCIETKIPANQLKMRNMRVYIFCHFITLFGLEQCGKYYRSNFVRKKFARDAEG